MKKIGKLIDEMNVGEISNLHLRSLVTHLKEKFAAGIDPLALTPETAQITPEKWHHTDHTDYSDYTPPHGDYCD